LDKEIFLRQFDETVENFAAELTSTPYAELAAEGIREWSEERSFTAFERLSDNYLIDYIKPAKYIVFGVEPLIGYLLAKEHEMKLIRIIMIGKLNDLPPEVIKERLRDTYAS
jgi:V/A-type H+-transporting ATPase subunit C